MAKKVSFKSASESDDEVIVWDENPEYAHRSLTNSFRGMNLGWIDSWFKVSLYGFQLVCEHYEESGDIDEADVKNIRTITNGVIKHKTLNYAIIMYLSEFEEFSECIRRELHLERDEKKKGSINRFKGVWDRYLGIDVNDLKQWQVLLDAEKIRNCVLHAAGRISLLDGKRKHMESLVKRYGLNVEVDRIIISEKLFNSVRFAVREILELGAEKAKPNIPDASPSRNSTEDDC
jgi:hypothetical protein